MLSIDQKISSISWQEQLATGFKDPHELLAYLHISATNLISPNAHKAFKTRVPKAFANKMKQGDLNDPLLKQVLPIAEEMQDILGYTQDPLQETAFNPVPGLLHKYKNRVLLTMAEACAINCRYCFRRHFDYKSNTPGRRGFSAMLDYIRAHTEIKEVIFSGGEPLLLPDHLLEEMIDQIAEIASVEILRFHTRMPIVLPDRVTSAFTTMLQKTRLQTVVIVHCNHSNELDSAISERMHSFRNVGTHVLNQSVLLKGINDNANILCQLSYDLLQAGILPYYLHVLDKVQGTAHFDIPPETAVQIHEDMRKQLPGYLLPRLVREIPHKLSKMPVY